MVINSRVGELRQALRYTAARKPHFLVVLGMHRSGTSVVSRILSLMGSHTGPVVREQAVFDTDDLHWEGSSLPWINEQILRRGGGSWDAPPERILLFRRDQWRARRFLWEFAGADIASFKDPRTCLTYPLWQRVLPAHSIIACVRHPMNVARSLSEREGWSLARGLDLWLTYNRNLLAHLTGASAVHWFDFDEGFAGVERLVDTLRCQYRLPGAAAAIRHYRPEHHHHNFTSAALPDAVQSVYDRLISSAAAA